MGECEYQYYLAVSLSLLSTPSDFLLVLLAYTLIDLRVERKNRGAGGRDRGGQLAMKPSEGRWYVVYGGLGKDASNSDVRMMVETTEGSESQD